MRAVLVRHVNRSIQIQAPDPEKLFLRLKQLLPKGAIMQHDGQIVVAYFYLPLLLKHLPDEVKAVGNPDIYLSRYIPAVDLVVKHLKMGNPDVFYEVQEEVSKPLVQALLNQKPPEEAKAIIDSLQRELERSRWIDAIWAAVTLDAVPLVATDGLLH